MGEGSRALAVVTGASTGIGFELARLAAERGYDLIIAADEAEIEKAAAGLRETGAHVTAVRADLSTIEGVDALYAAVQQAGKPVSALMANAGRGLGHSFLDQPVRDWRFVVDTNITGTVYLVQLVARDMRTAGAGQILITGSIAGFIPGAFQAVYNGTKAFLNSFSFALRNELKDSGITVTCLMPGATETEFFDRAHMEDTPVGESAKDDPRDVARVGFEAMLAGESDVVAGWKNKLQTTVANVTPNELLAEQHRRMAEPKR